jgi:hypothetical protein
VIEPDPAALREGVAPDDESRKPVSIDRFQTARVALHLRRVALLRGRVLLEDGSALGGGTAVLRELQPPGVHGVNRSGALFGTEPTGPRPPPTARKDATIGPDGAFEITVASLGDWEVTEVTRVVPVAGGAPRFERFVPCAKAVLARDADSVVTVRPSSAAPPGSR